MLFMVIFIPLSIPVSWAIDRYGLRKSTCFGALLMAVFALLRALAGPSYALALAGTAGLAFAQPFLQNAWTKMAAHWFAESERATAVGLVTLSNLLGIAVGMVASPALAAALSISATQYVYAIAAIASAAVYLSVPSFRLFLAVVFVGMGLFNGLTTWIDEIVAPRGYGASEGGTLGALLLLGGIVGAVAIPALSDGTGKRKLWMLVVLAACLVPFMEEGEPRPTELLTKNEE
jgi:MFS family permease